MEVMKLVICPICGEKYYVKKDAAEGNCPKCGSKHYAGYVS